MTHVVIDGIIDVPRIHRMMPDMVDKLGPEGLIDPNAIAEAYWQLHRQPRSAWTFELDVRPFKESF